MATNWTKHCLVWFKTEWVEVITLEHASKARSLVKRSPIFFYGNVYISGRATQSRV